MPQQTEQPSPGLLAGPEQRRGGTSCTVRPAVRHDPALERVVNGGLVEWARQMGIFPGRLDVRREMNFGRLITLTYVDTDDCDRLLAVAPMTLAWWTADDYYCDDASLGSVPALLGSRLALAYTAADPIAMPDRYTADLHDAVEGHVNRIKMLKRQMYGRTGFACCGSESSLSDRSSVARRAGPFS
jgi:2-methylisoborneol synthase